MPHHLRYQSAEWALHHVVSRCINGFSFLKPTPATVQICKGVLGRALAMYSKRIKLIHMAFLSNHFHLLLESEDVHALSQFMQYLKSNLSRELAREHDWQGAMWQSRFASEEILDEESLEEIFKYITENSVKEGLVDHPRAWRGLHGFHQLVDLVECEGSWLDRTALFHAKQNTKTRDQVKTGDFITSYKVELTKPRMWSKLSEEQYHRRCVELCDEAIKSARAKRVGRSMGMARVLAQPVFKARRPKRGTRPLCRAKTVELFKAYRQKYWDFKKAFHAAYQHARDQVVAGISPVEMLFPFGGIAPLSVIGLSELPDPVQRE